jgi:peptide/nickel transport system permease protein
VPEPSERTVGMGAGLGSAIANVSEPASAMLMAEDVFGTSAAVEGLIAPPSGRAMWKRLGWGFWVAVTICVLWVLAASLAGVLPLPNPDFAQLNPAAPDYCFQSLGHPYASHLLGCDYSGRDILSRVIYGSRVSLIVGFGSIAMGLVFGGVLGIISGYFRGWIDEVLSVLANVFLSFPSLVLALVIVAFLGRSQTDIVLIIAVVAWPLLFRVVRASTIEYSQREYVLAAQALGSKPSRILRTLLLPDVVPSAITYGLVGVALAIVAEGALSFVGQSVPSPTPTWGNMIYSGSQYITQDVTLLIVPAVAMFSFILPINYVGDRLRQVLDTRQGVL